MSEKNEQQANHDPISTQMNTGVAFQPVIYGMMPEQSGNQADLTEFFIKLLSQWKLIFGISIGGTLLAILYALTLPAVYKPSVTLSLPSTGDVAAFFRVNSFIEGEEGNTGYSSTPQAVFADYYDLLRSKSVLTEYVDEKNYLQKIYTDSSEDTSVQLAKLFTGVSSEVLESLGSNKNGYVEKPKLVSFSIAVANESIGVDLINGYVDFVNQRLITKYQRNISGVIRSKIEVLSKQVSSLREEYRQKRIQEISKTEQLNALKIAVLNEEVSALLKKAKENRVTEMAKSKEALEIAKSLEIVYPTTLAELAQKGKKETGSNTAITVVDEASSPLYLQGTKYLSKQIEILQNRENDEDYLEKISDLKEMIYMIENDKELEALKLRKSDDPWIDGLSEKLAKIDMLKTLNVDISDLTAYNLDSAAIVTKSKVKPKRSFIVLTGLLLSVVMALFAAMLITAVNSKKQESV